MVADAVCLPKFALLSLCKESHRHASLTLKGRNAFLTLYTCRLSNIPLKVCFVECGRLRFSNGRSCLSR
eukprot:scaffold67659_cov18-Prasinocladus_malaysianus.AAC.1